MEKSELGSLESLTTGAEIDVSKLNSILNFFMSQNLPWKVDIPNEEVKPVDSGSKTEPQSPTSCCLSLFNDLELGEEPGTVLHITVTFPDLKELYFKTQSRVGRHSRQRVVKGKVKVCVATGGHQVQTIEVYVERTPDAAHLVGDRCGRVYLKPQPGQYFSSKYYFTVDLDSVYESPRKHGVPVYKLSTVDSERRNNFRLVVVVILIGDTRSKEFISPPFRLRSKTNGRFRSMSL